MSRCRKCGKPLKDKDSIRRGMGPTCQRKAEEVHGDFSCKNKSSRRV